MTERVDQYQRNAEKCLELSRKFNDNDAKRIMLTMSNAWLLLAALRATSVESAPASEPPLPVNEPLPANELPPLRLNPAKPNDPVQC